MPVTAVLLLAVLHGCMQKEWCVTTKLVFRELETFSHTKKDSVRDQIILKALPHLESLQEYIQDTSLMEKAWKMVCDSAHRKHSNTLPWWHLEIASSVEEKDQIYLSEFDLRMCTHHEDTSVELLNAWLKVMMEEDNRRVEDLLKMKVDSIKLVEEQLENKVQAMLDSLGAIRYEPFFTIFSDFGMVSGDTTGYEAWRKAGERLHAIESIRREAEREHLSMSTKVKFAIPRVQVLIRASKQTAEK